MLDHPYLMILAVAVGLWLFGCACILTIGRRHNTQDEDQAAGRTVDLDDVRWP